MRMLQTKHFDGVLPDMEHVASGGKTKGKAHNDFAVLRVLQHLHPSGELCSDNVRQDQEERVQQQSDR